MAPYMTVDLRSDTVTQPTPAMRRAMAEAEVGDDGFRDDPTVLRLEEKAAEMLGKEAALLMPSGTMANLCAILAHTQWGDEVIVEARSHTQVYEHGGWSVLGGRISRQLNGRLGMFDLEELEAAIQPHGDLHCAGTGLICLENTHMLAGGIPLTPEQVQAVADVAHRHHIPLHVDGARLFNAAVALGVPAKELVAPADSVQFCLSKGLSCPIGSLLVGSRELIQKAHQMRQMLGGTMRQAGVIAAAGLVALDTMIDRLAEDHDHARRLAEGIAEIGHGLEVDLSRVRTNIVYVSTAGFARGAEWLLRRLEEEGVRALTIAPEVVRMVTHYGIERRHIDYALQVISRAAADA